MNAPLPKYAEQADVTTLQGVVNKTAILLSIAVVAGTFGYWMIGQVATGAFVTISCLVSMGVCFGAYMVLRGNPAHARNVFILGIASLWLIIDFGMVEEKVVAAAPKHMEWYLGFALLVTLAWIYYEAVKLAFRLAILLGNRN